LKWKNSRNLWADRYLQLKQRTHMIHRNC